MIVYRDSDVYLDILPSVVLSYYLVRKMAIFASKFNCVLFDCMQLPAFPSFVVACIAMVEFNHWEITSYRLH